MGNRNRTCKAELLFIPASIQIAAEWRGCSALGPSLFAIFCGEYFAAQFCIWSRVGWASKNLETKPTVICVCALDRCRSRNACVCLCQHKANQSGHSLQRLEKLPEYHVASSDMSKLRDFAFLRFSSCSSLSCFGLVTGIPTNKWNTLVVQSPCTLRGNALVKTTSSCRRILARRLRLERPLTEDN